MPRMAPSVVTFALLVLACGLPAQPVRGEDPPAAPPVQADAAAAAVTEPAQCPTAEAPFRALGDAGDLRRVELVGIRQCDPVAVRRAMLTDLPLQAAARPSAPLRDFLEVLEGRLTAGYAHSGFPEAVVDVTFDPVTEVVAACIHEGQQYAQGAVRVTGGTAEVRKELAALVQQPARETTWTEVRGAEDRRAAGKQDDAFVWRRGEPVQLGAGAPDKLVKRVDALLSGLGYPAAQADVAVSANPARGEFELTIAVANLGRQARVAQIDVRGLSRHTQEQVLEFLDIAVGDDLHDGKIAALHERLRQSCRFWQYDVAVYRTGGRGSRYGGNASDAYMVLDLVEYEHTPPLGEPLGKLDAALARIANALSDDPAAAGLTNLVFQLRTPVDAPSDKGSATGREIDSTGYFKYAGGVGQGALIEAAFSEKQLTVNHSLLVTPQELCCCDWRAATRYRLAAATDLRVPATMNVSMQQDKRCEGSDYRCRFRIGMAFASQDEPAAPLITLALDPVCLVNVAHMANAEVVIDGNMACITVWGGTMTVDLENQQIASIVSDDPAGGMTVSTRRASFAREAQRVRRRSEALAERCDPDHPTASAVRFVVESLATDPYVQSDPLWTLACQQTQLLVDSGELGEHLAKLGWNRWTDGDDAAKRAKYRIPTPLGPVASEFKLKGVDAYGAVVGMYVPYAADVLAPRGSWLWTAAREAGFAHVDATVHTHYSAGADAELARVLSDERTGPLGRSLCSAVVTAYWPDEKRRAAEPIDWAGLSAEDVQADIRLAVYGDHGLARLVRAAFAAYVELPPASRPAVDELLPPQLRDLCRDVAGRVAGESSTTIAEAAEATLLAAWNSELRDAAATRVQQLVEARIRQARAATSEQKR